MTELRIKGRPVSFYAALALGMAILAVLMHLYAIDRYSSGMPYRDDFEAVLDFLNAYPELHFPDNWRLVFSQNNEHRIVLDHLVSLLMVFLTGKFSFIWMIWIGNVGWFLLLLLFWKFANQNQVSLLEFSPIVIAMMSFSHYELMTMAMAAVQHYFQIFFCVWAIWFMVGGRAYLTLALFTCAIFTSGGGICLVPVLFLYYLWKKEWRNFGLSVLVVGAVFLVYFPLLGYVQNPGVPSALSAFQSPAYLAVYALGFLGGIGNLYKVSIGLGLVFAVMLAWQWRVLVTKYPFLFWLTAYLFVTAFTNAVTRGGLGIRTGQGSRYTAYSLIFTTIVYLCYLLNSSNVCTRLRVLWIGMFVSIAMFAYWYAHGQESLQARFDALESGVIEHPYRQWPEKSIIRAGELGYYTPTRTPR